MACIVEALGLRSAHERHRARHSRRPPPHRRSQRQARRGDGHRRHAQAKRPHHGRLRPQRHDRPAGHRRIHERLDSPDRDGWTRRRVHSTSMPSTNSAARFPSCSTSSPPARTTWSISTTPAACPHSCANSPPLLDLNAPTISGGTLGDAIAAAEEVPGQDVIRTLAAPLKKEGAMADAPRQSGAPQRRHQALRRLAAT